LFSSSNSLINTPVFSFQLKTISKTEAIAAPLPKIIQDRVDRKAAYAMTKTDISKWKDTVRENRKAEHLSFPLGQPKLPFNADPKINLATAPANDLEREINSVLVSEGLKQKEEDTEHTLPDNAPSLDELEDARDELKKLRSMMFFYQQKAKRLKKIKSKKYHKILKKEKLKKELSLHEIAMLDPEKAAQMKEKMLLDRAAVKNLFFSFSCCGNSSLTSRPNIAVCSRNVFLLDTSPEESGQRKWRRGE